LEKEAFWSGMLGYRARH